MVEKKETLIATGRRKEAIARVIVNLQGQGKIFVNGRDFTDYFTTVDQRMLVKRPLILTETDGALSLGIARCLVEWNPQLRVALRREDLLTRDPRAKERKKYGRKGARRRFQWTKR